MLGAPRQSRGERRDQLVSAYLENYPGGLWFRNYVRDLWHSFSQMEIAELDQFVMELTGVEPGKFWQRLWEMQLADRLTREGHTLRSIASGPDFAFHHQGVRVWVEAVSPEPCGLPPDWMRHLQGEITGEAYSFPHEQILLRWTGAFDTKARKFARYRSRQITSDGDVCIIAISGAQLDFFPSVTGITQLPFAVEAVFPVGPLQVTFHRDAPSTTGRAFRLGIKNHRGAPVSLCPFLDPAFADISAVIGCGHRYAPDGVLPLQVVHNPLARVPAAKGMFGTGAEEWVATPTADGTTYELRKEE